ncbi:hypothetical protein [Vagococcus jeotgali]|uniref:hypothetical protein n=1 Tax=Vagococcus jeotgali TaxID=3109030 RepID=UPI002DD927B3|nr:hypothetical protein [Vagococcus sp. B2T-5]
MLLFALVLIFIGIYLNKQKEQLLLLFTQDNSKNISTLAIWFITLACMGIILGIFIPTKMILLVYVAIVLIISAIFSTKIANNMKS